MEAPVVLILGAGPNIGQNVADLFTSKGYRVAAVSRREQQFGTADKVLHLQGDLADLKAIPAIFEKLKEVWGVPSVVIYNGAALSQLNERDPFGSFSLDQFMHDSTINVHSAIVTAYHAIEGFKRLPPSPHKTFIYTGNKLNMMPSPRVMYFGMGKTAMAHVIWDCSVAYRDQGFKFYYTDERLADGRPARAAMSGQVRAEACLNLVEDPEQGPWHYTIVKGQGYTDFAEIDRQAALNNSYE